MHSLVFFGSLRSKKLLKIVIGKDIVDYLKFNNAKAKKSKLFKVKNENFPYLEKSNRKEDKVICTFVEDLKKIKLKKIIFYESIEYKLSKINLKKKKKEIETNYFELIKKNKSTENWSYKLWKFKFEKLSCIAAIKWMSLFNKYKDNPGDAEVYWQKILTESSKEII